MSFEDGANRIDRRPATVVEIDLDYCDNYYGTSPCTASAAIGNYLKRSVVFSHAIWVRTDVTFDSNLYTDPFDNLTADIIKPGASLGLHNIKQEILIADVDRNKSGALSLYVSYIDGSPYESIELRLLAGVFDYGTFVFNTRTGAVLEANTATPTAFGYEVTQHTNAAGRVWYRLIIGVNELPDFGDMDFTIGCVENDGNRSFAGDTINGVLIACAQFRQDADEHGAGIFSQTGISRDLPEASTREMCFNCLGTCQDVPNYTPGTKTYSFTTQRVQDDTIVNAIPCIKSIRYAPTKLDIGKGLSIRSTITVTMQDFTHSDVGVDKYVLEREGGAFQESTFFNKLKARNQYYAGRELRLKEGYINDAGDLTDYVTRTYIIDNVVGVDKSGKLRITAKDYINLARKQKATCPTVKDIYLNGDVTDTQTSGWDANGADIADLSVGDYLRLDDEIVYIDTKGGSGNITVTRGHWGTSASAHSDGAAIQICKIFSDVNVADVVQELLEDYAGIPASALDYANWILEAGIVGYDLTTCISEPTAVSDLLKEIVECTLIDLWFDDLDGLVKLTLNSPYDGVDQMLTDDVILAGSGLVKDLEDRRLTRAIINYDRKNYAKDAKEKSNYSRNSLEIAVDEETSDFYGDIRIKEIFTRWLDATNVTQVELTSARLMERFTDTPKLFNFSVDAKDMLNYKVGQVFDTVTRYIADENGDKELTRFQVIEQKPIVIGHSYAISAFAFFAPPTDEGTFVIDTDEVDFNLYTALINPVQPIEITVVVNAGVEVTATQGNPAFTTGALHPDSVITLVNNGFIYGHSGNGGQAGDIDYFRFRLEELPTPGSFAKYTHYMPALGTSHNNPPKNEALPGGNGGDCIEITVSNFIIDNTLGSIYGGGGGGAGGYGAADQTPTAEATTTSPPHNGGVGGCSGGGGKGSDGSAFPYGVIWQVPTKVQSAYTNEPDLDVPKTIIYSVTGGANPDTIQWKDGNAGAIGTDLVAGAGGVETETVWAGVTHTAVAGGNGGDWATEGDAHTSQGLPEVAGGNPGAAIITNGATLVFLDGGALATDIKGAVI